MDTKEFKNLFGNIAKSHGFKSAHGGWHREVSAALLVLNLQKSNFGNYFEMNLKLFLGETAVVDSAELKERVKSMSGDIFRRQPEEYSDAFNLDSSMSLADRRAAIEKMFRDLIDHIVSAGTAGSAGILRLRDEGVLFVLPSVEARLKAS
jgi:hypothetical protein